MKVTFIFVSLGCFFQCFASKDQSRNGNENQPCEIDSQCPGSYCIKLHGNRYGLCANSHLPLTRTCKSHYDCQAGESCECGNNSQWGSKSASLDYGYPDPDYCACKTKTTCTYDTECPEAYYCDKYYYGRPYGRQGTEGQYGTCKPVTPVYCRYDEECLIGKYCAYDEYYGPKPRVMGHKQGPGGQYGTCKPVTPVYKKNIDDSGCTGMFEEMLNADNFIADQFKQCFKKAKGSSCKATGDDCIFEIMETIKKFIAIAKKQ